MCWLKGKESTSIFFVFIAVSLTVCPTWTAAQTLLDLLKRSDEMSKFSQLVRQSPYLNASLPYRELVTLFVPTNAAIKEYLDRGGKIDNYTLRYHLANVARNLNELDDNVLSDLPGNSPIWVTRRGTEVYLNDAKIIGNPSKASSSEGYSQYLYKIDRVLEPTLPTTGSSILYNPDARTFLERHGEYSITGNRKMSDFAQRVSQVQKLDDFQKPGTHTFFIPIDEALKKPSVKQAISAKVVEGHIIPNKVIFTRLAVPGEDLQTVAFSTDLKVLVSIENRTVDGVNTWVVQSDTKIADANHRKGIVQSEIIKANIPVKNGVVHIISKPLVVIDETVYQTLADAKQNGGLTQEFVTTLKNMGRDIFERIGQRDERGITVFVPTNEAMLEAKANLERMNSTKLQEILKLHIVPGVLTSDNITQQHQNDSENYQVGTLANGKKLFFNMVDNGYTRTFYVEGGGVNATITKPDIAATDGVIHLINKVLGFADLSVYDKIRTDPMLKETFKLTSQENFNERFKDSNTKFTIFAPSNEAWKNIWFRAPSEYKKLESGNYGYHVGVIMRRHILVNQVLTIEDLHELTRTGKRIPTIAGDLEVKYKTETSTDNKYLAKPYPNQRLTDNFDYMVYWNFQWARVIRPNINCTNGVIHIIDTVLMKPEDVTVSSSGHMAASVLQSIFIPIITISLFIEILVH